MKSQLILSASLLISLLFLTDTLHAQIDREAGNIFSTRSEVIAERGMVATSQPLATQVGLHILRNGGNAIDAAIGANAAMGLMEPTGNGIGGDLFAIIWHQETEQLYALNASGRSPMGLSYDRLMSILDEMDRNSIPPYDLLSVSVPGAVDGWFKMHDRFGSAEMEDILSEPIWYAENGFPVSQAISEAWQCSASFLSGQPGAFEETFTIDGEGPEKGEIFHNPDLGNTFRLLAEKGRDAFYRGEIAEKIDEWMRENDGYLRYEDFESHHSDWVDPQTTNYRGYDVYQVGGNVQGTAVLQMLNILEGFDLEETGFGTAETLHLMIEAKKLAFEDRAKHYADPDFHDVPYETLLSKEYAAERRELIGNTAMEDITTGVDVLEDGDTIYLTAADDEGNMVSLIQSNFRGMGTGFVVPGTAFRFQNRGEMFVLKEGHPNSFEPGKRPFTTIIPAFITVDGKPWISFGLMGGGMQPQGHAQIVMNLVDFGMGLQEAGDAPRIHHRGSTEPTGQNLQMTDGGMVNLESGFSYDTVRALMKKGHRIQHALGPYGGYQAIMVDPEFGTYRGATEVRKDGQAAGY